MSSEALIRSIEGSRSSLNAVTAAEFEAAPRVAVYMTKRPLVALYAEELRNAGHTRLPIREYDLSDEKQLAEFLDFLPNKFSTSLGGRVVIGWMERHGHLSAA